LLGEIFSTESKSICSWNPTGLVAYRPKKLLEGKRLREVPALVFRTSFGVPLSEDTKRPTLHSRAEQIVGNLSEGL